MVFPLIRSIILYFKYMVSVSAGVSEDQRDKFFFELAGGLIGLSCLVGFWSSVFIRRIIYIFKVRPFANTAFRLVEKVGIQ